MDAMQQMRKRWRAWARANGYPKANGAILWKGPAPWDPSVDAVAIATGLDHPSANGKTDDMIQTWILVDDGTGRGPQQIAEDLDDEPICGDCPHRYQAPEEDLSRPVDASILSTGKRLREALRTGDHDHALRRLLAIETVSGKRRRTVITALETRIKGRRSCYVTLIQAPRSIWETYQRGGYPEISPARLANLTKGARWRLGSYGDPAAIPVDVWQTLTHTAAGWTGYTHAWRRLDAALWAPLVMASTDTDEDTDAAHAAGWRQFRVVAEHAPISRGRLLVAGLTLRQCPATTPAALACSVCRACDGTSRGAKRPSIVIPAHGNGASHVG